MLVEDHLPPESLWNETLVSSRLIEYEIWARLHSRGLSESHGESARSLLARFNLLELAPPVLAQALETFPTPVRTLDALHLASADYLRRERQAVSLATYDVRLLEAARHMRIPLFPL
ncbi:MAG: PIN domain-containing protein [Planctomycetota bacterium]